jgi:hypothetical protein
MSGYTHGHSIKPGCNLCRYLSGLVKNHGKRPGPKLLSQEIS